MRIEVFSNFAKPPEGFVATPPLEDFGCPRSVFNAAEKISLHLGDALVTRSDGSHFVLRAVEPHSLTQRELLLLLTEAAHDGVEFV